MNITAGVTRIGHYLVNSELGAGTFSTVWLAMHELTKVNVAIKVISKASVQDEEALTRLVRELNLMKQMHHPFIAEFYESLEDDDAYYYCMEFAEHGNLLGYISMNGSLSEIQARHIFSQVISVLDYLHTERHVCHRDVKAENMLLDRHNNVRVIDFGLSNQFTSSRPLLKTVCGSPPYVAPEMVKGKPYSRSADVWSAGVLLYSMTTGALPFDDDHIQSLLTKIVSRDVVYPSYLSPSLIDLLRRMLTKNPDLRITVPEIRDHEWFSANQYTGLFALDLGGRAAETRIAADIIQEMAEMGIETALLQEQLSLGVSTDLTAMYRMLRRGRLTDSMRDLIARLAVHSDPQRTLDEEDMPQLHVKARSSATPHTRALPVRPGFRHYRNGRGGRGVSPAPMQFVSRRELRPLSSIRPVLQRPTIQGGECLAD
jgi:tRNA A-37 threonylcarbamoyl transferase component Bud32